MARLGALPGAMLTRGTPALYTANKHAAYLAVIQYGVWCRKIVEW